MSIYNTVQSGTKVFRSRFPNKFQRLCSDISFGKLYPVYKEFVLPGDVFRLSYDELIRMQPMRAPYLNRNYVTTRYFFVPLRLVEPNTEFIITGSREGHYDSSADVPEFENIFETYKRLHPNETSVTNHKGSVAEWLFGLPVGEYDISENGSNSVLHNLSSPASYWFKAYLRIWFDYYRDENLQNQMDFDSSEVVENRTWWSWLFVEGGITRFNQFYKKDYFTSALPWQLKGIAPTVPISISTDFTGVDYQLNNFTTSMSNAELALSHVGSINWNVSPVAFGTTANIDVGNAVKTNLKQVFDAALSAGTAGFNADELRLMMAQTRMFERLARTGSRYTEYLRANFNTAPADGTLQRAQYLGGGKQDIVLTEVVQTAGATNDQGNETPVGTLRGHGITRGGYRLSRCHFSEFGMVIGILSVMPERIYSSGINRQFTYKSRWDFFNPSFQHLSEQEVRNGEVYFGTDGLNDDTFGFQGMYNELRSGTTSIIGDLRDNLSYWTQASLFTARPNLNFQFLRAQPSDYLRPFDVTDEDLARPMILDFCTYNDCYRPMVREPVPGLVDHN